MRYLGVKVRDARQAFLVTREAHNLGKQKDARSSRGQRDAGAEGGRRDRRRPHKRADISGSQLGMPKRKERHGKRVVTAMETAPCLHNKPPA